MELCNPFPICTVPSTFPPRYRPLIDHLSSHVGLHRSTSLSTLSSIVSTDAKAASDMINGGIIPIILPLVLDSDANIALNAVVFLRNLSLIDGASFSQKFISLRIFDDVVHLLLNRSDNLQWSTQLLSVLTSVTEFDNHSHCKCITDESIWALSSYALFPGQQSTTVVELFRNIIEDSPQLARSLSSNTTCMIKLQSCLRNSNASPLTQAHVAALFADISRLAVNLAPDLLAETRPILASCIAIDLSEAQRQLISRAQHARTEIETEVQRQMLAHTGDTIFQESINGKLAPEAIDDSWQRVFQQFRDQVLAVHTVMETIANLVCIDQEDKSWSLEQIIALTGIEPLLPTISAHMVTIIGEDYFQHPDWPRVSDLLSVAIERSVDCMTNLVFNGVVKGEHIVPPLLNAIETHRRCSTPPLSLMESMGRLLSLSVVDCGLDIDESQLEVISCLAATSTSEAIRQEFTSVLAKYAIGNPARASVVGGRLCLRLQDESLRVLLEAVNGIIDVFSDDGVHAETILNLKLIQVLQVLAVDDKSWDCRQYEDDDLAEDAEQTRENLKSFIVYRSQCL